MYNIISEERIGALITEPKPEPPGLVPLGVMSQRNQHYRKDFRIMAPSGNEFLVAIRKATLNIFDFSVILGYQLPHLHTVFRLRRYNGKSHPHTNPIEKERSTTFIFPHRDGAISAPRL
jgi:hypothetical protein